MGNVDRLADRDDGASRDSAEEITWSEDVNADASPKAAAEGDVVEVIPGRDDAPYRFSRKLKVLSDPTGVESSAVGALRNHLSQQHLRLGRRSLAICSASADVDRALVSANLALAAAQSGLSTVLVDANFRETEINTFFQSSKPDQLGLSDYLSGGTDDIADILQTDVIGNLTLISAGQVPDDPQSLLAGERFDSLLTALLRNFDFTIIDCPAASHSADARRIASVARYALIVAKRDVSFVGDVKQLIDELTSDRVSVIGTFLNVG